MSGQIATVAKSDGLQELLSEFRNWNWRHAAFYIGAPLIVAVSGALNNWGLLASIGYFGAVSFYLAQALVPWWITCTMTSISMLGLKPWKPPPIVLMLIGTTLGNILTLPYANWVVRIFDAAYPVLDISTQFTALFSANFWSYMLQSSVVWVAVNFFFDRFVGLPRYRYVIPRGYDFHDLNKTKEESSDADETTRHGSGYDGATTVAQRPAPGFLERIPAIIELDGILAIKAEQHYIRVYTAEREYMVLYRFSDAVRELEPTLGLQVHRSYWVNRNAIERLRHSAKKWTVLLNSGLELPVSGPYQGLVRQTARESGIPTSPHPASQ